MTGEPFANAEQLPDHYATLQVVPEAEAEVIQAAYRRLAQKYHPDVAGPEAAERMAALNAAWEVLGDPERRSAYDEARLVARQAATTLAGTSAREPPHPRYRAAPAGPGETPAETSPLWTSGRSTVGSRYDPHSMRTPEGRGAAGRPPGNPSGSVLNFGRYAGWSLGEIARHDPEYLEWLDRMQIGRAYREEMDQLLRRLGRRRTAPPGTDERRGLYRRR